MRCKKKPIVLRFVRAVAGEVVSTLEGPITAQAGDAIITGTRGERWPVNAARFAQTYSFSEAEGTCQKRPDVVTATKEPAPFEVKVGWAAEPLQGAAGDYRVRNSDGEEWVVAADIFAETYELLS